MNQKNNFTEKTRSLFAFNFFCFYCWKSGADALHHILGRCSNSPLNACPIHNHKCHLYNPDLNRKSTKKRLLRATYKYLMKEGYKLTDKDREFMKKYKEYYQEAVSTKKD